MVATGENEPRAYYDALGASWYKIADPARKEAERLTANTAVLHFVVALDLGVLLPPPRGSGQPVRRAALADKGRPGPKMFRPFNLHSLARYLEQVRTGETWGPSCLNFYEEVADARPRRVAFDLEFDTGSEDHLERARALWPDDYREVARSGQLFLQRMLVEKLLPAVNAFAHQAVTTHDCFLSESSSATKLSFHVATTLVLPTKDARLVFDAWVKDELKHELAPLFDAGVYGSARNMRLPLCRKPFKLGDAADKPWLRPVSCLHSLQFAQTVDAASADGPVGFSAELLEQHMWSVTQTDSELCKRLIFLDEDLGDAGTRKRQRISEGPMERRKRPASCDTERTEVPADVWTALAALGFDSGSLKPPKLGHDGDYAHFHYDARCPLCNAKVHTSNYVVSWVNDEQTYSLRSLAPSCSAKVVSGILRAAMEEPLKADLRPWPLPRRFWFYEPTFRREFGPTVRCIDSQRVGCDEDAAGYRAVFHKFTVQYDGADGAVHTRKVGVSMDQAELWVEESGDGPRLRRVSWQPEYGVGRWDEVQRLDHWWRHAWGDAFRQLGARPGDARLHPPYSWVLDELGVCFPWQVLRRIDVLVLNSRRRRE